MTTTQAERGFERIGEVDALPIEKLLDAETLRSIQLIKIDVEGGEAAILSHFIATLDRYSDTVELIVELSPARSGAEQQTLDRLFEAFQANGFRSYAIENRYDLDWYMAWKGPSKPTEIKSYPQEQTDILFTRSVI
jgi:hypothetical protein